MKGFGGSDIFTVADGNDTVLGGSGNDGVTLASAIGANLLDGGADHDSLQLVLLSQGVTLDASQEDLVIGAETSIVCNFEVYYLTRHDDTFTGTGDVDIVVGGGGNDVMTGLAGKDTFVFDMRVDDGDDAITDFDLARMCCASITPAPTAPRIRASRIWTCSNWGLTRSSPSTTATRCCCKGST